MAYLKTAQLCCENLGGANDSWRHVMWLAHSAGRSGVAGMIVPAPHCFPSRSSASILPHLSLEKKIVSSLDGEKVSELVFSPVSKQLYFTSLNRLKVICVTSHGLNIFRSTLIVFRQLLFVCHRCVCRVEKCEKIVPNESESLRGIQWIL